jgi:hypothetical protein
VSRFWYISSLCQGWDREFEHPAADRTNICQQNPPPPKFDIVNTNVRQRTCLNHFHLHNLLPHYWAFPYCPLYSSWLPKFLMKIISSASRATGRVPASRATGRVRLPAEARDFLYSTESRQALGPIQPPIQWLQGALSVGVKRPGCEADHSPPSSAEVRNTWSIHQLPHTPSWRTA